MIAYFDTSALIPLLIEEAGSERSGRVWDAAEHVTSVRLIYAEARAAAERVQNGTTVMVAGDGDLCAAAEGISLAVARTHGEGG